MGAGSSRSPSPRRRTRRRSGSNPRLAASSGGGGGIRTPGTREGTVVFKTTALNRSATPPSVCNLLDLEGLVNVQPSDHLRLETSVSYLVCHI